MSYHIQMTGTFHVEPQLSADGCAEVAASTLGWRCTPNGAILYLPSDVAMSDPFAAFRTAVQLIARLGSSVAGEAHWEAEDGSSGSLSVVGGDVQVATDPDEPLAESELLRLIESLRSGPEPDRVESMKILCYLSVPLAKFAEPLSQCLRHDAASVRLAAANTLCHFGEEASVALEPLIVALDDSEAWVQAAAAEALGLIGCNASAALPALRRLEKHPNYGPSGRAREAIARILA